MTDSERAAKLRTQLIKLSTDLLAREDEHESFGRASEIVFAAAVSVGSAKSHIEFAESGAKAA